MNEAQQCIDCCEAIKAHFESHKAKGVQGVGAFNWMALILPILQAILNSLQQNTQP